MGIYVCPFSLQTKSQLASDFRSQGNCASSDLTRLNPKHLLRLFSASKVIFSKDIFKSARKIPFKTRLKITF